MPSDAVWNNLINMLGPALVILILAIAAWIKARSIERKIDTNAQTAVDVAKTLQKQVTTTANELSDKTAAVAKTLSNKTDEQTKVLTDGHKELTDRVEKIQEQTNGLTAALVKDASEKGFRDGGDAERNK